MVTRFTVGLALMLGGSTIAMAQSAAAPTVEQQWVGTWEGTFESDHAAAGPMQLIVARDSVLRVTLRMMVGSEIYVTEGRLVRIDDGVLQWIQDTMGAECRGGARIEQAVLTGQTDCGGGGLRYALMRVRQPTPMGAW